LFGSKQDAGQGVVRVGGETGDGTGGEVVSAESSEGGEGEGSLAYVVGGECSELFVRGVVKLGRVVWCVGLPLGCPKVTLVFGGFLVGQGPRSLKELRVERVEKQGVGALVGDVVIGRSVTVVGSGNVKLVGG
jgi:hypothetical protein